MLKVWGRNNSINVQKVMWAVAELGLEHERVDAGGAFGGLDTADYGVMNPNRRVPTIEDGGTVVWESHAVVRYLAANYGAGGLWPDAPADRAVADQWMDWQHTTLGDEMRIVFWGLIRTPEAERDYDAIKAAAIRLGGLWAMLDARLDGRKYVVGDALSVGDIPVGANCYRYMSLDIERPDLPNLARWYAALQERPAFREHVMIPLS